MSGVPVISPVVLSISTPLGKVPLSSYSIPFATGSEKADAVMLIVSLVV